MKRITLAMLAALASFGVATAQTMNAPISSGVGAADNTSLRTWMSDYSRTNKGYISRQAYMDEMGRRWDAMDRNHRGLTVDEVNSMYGDSQPNPGMTHAQTNGTNPSGTEPKGQNSGGQ
jgi:hypothetical protein